jgi:phenylpropionate dioxygenase-like ring-hydroxylating dioxygenase large terminal subunit
VFGDEEAYCGFRQKKSSTREEVMTIVDHPSIEIPVLPVDSYVSRDWAQRERDRLWPRVWQMACREEEIPEPGDYYTYDILDDSIVVVRREDGAISAHFNTCPHRGRRLTEGCGRAKWLHCRFHGWRFGLDGKVQTVIDREDWGGALDDATIGLTPVKVDTWGGWVWINMDPGSESLADFLEPAKAMLEPFEFHRMAYSWRKQIVIPCNWKTALEAFNEAYHVQTTHPQLLPYHDDVSYSQAIGKHGMFGMDPTRIFGLPSPRLGIEKADIRKGLAEFNRILWETLRATTTQDMVTASARLLELPEDISVPGAFAAFDRFHREELAKRGATMPDVTYEQQIAAGIDWHIFPNMVFLHSPTNLLGYRARPNGDDPDSCIFEAYQLIRLAEGEKPQKVEVEHGASWRDVEWGLILEQDFQNMAEVQRGMKVRGFKGIRLNPVKELAVRNFHQVLENFLEERG